MEIWKDIEGYEGLYKVSNLGRVKSFKCNRTRILKLSPKKEEYLGVMLYKDDKRTSKYIHKLVANAFLERQNCDSVVDHINNIHSDNHVDNLQYISQRENLLKNHPKKNNLFQGIVYNKPRGCYYANIQLGYKKIFLGGHKTDKEYLSSLYTKAKELIHFYDGNDKSFRELVRSNLI